MKQIEKAFTSQFPYLIYRHMDIQRKQYSLVKGVSKQEMEEGPEEVFIDFSANPKGEYIVKIRDLTKKDPVITERAEPVSRK